MERPNASSIKKGDFVILEERPCRIIDFKHSKVGKHGVAKTKLDGIDCIDGSKHIVLFAGDPRIYKFLPIKRTLQLINIKDEQKYINIECFDEEANPITLDINENSRKIINDNKIRVSNINKTFYANTITVPVPKANNKDNDYEFDYETIIDSFTEE